MPALLIIFAGMVAGLMIGIVFGISICTTRHMAAGVPIQSTNRFIQLWIRPTASYSSAGRLLFTLLMLVWTCILFGSIGAPIIVARLLGFETDFAIKIALSLEFLVCMVSAFAAHQIWRKRVFGA